MAAPDALADEGLHARGVEQVLMDEAPPVAATPSAAPRDAATDAQSGPNPMIMLARATMEAQGRVPTFADFAAVPHQNPFAAAPPPQAPSSA